MQNLHTLKAKEYIEKNSWFKENLPSSKFDKR